MSGVTYYSIDSIDKWSCPDCAKLKVDHAKAFYYSSTNTQGFTGYIPSTNQIIVAFRGSTDIKNWITNLNTVSTSYPFCNGCQVHQGFYATYNGVSSLVKSQVEKLMTLFTSAKIVFTGHSLGGALAVLCALDLHRTYNKFDHLTTFGQPRVGNDKLAAYITQQLPNTFRVINYADTVVHAPPSAFGFRHGGH